MMSSPSSHEAAIWAEVINGNFDAMPESAAMTVLGWTFSDESKMRMEMLASRNGQGTLSNTLREEQEASINVGQVIAILQAKARLSLQRKRGN